MSATSSPWLADAFQTARDDFLKDIKHPERFNFTKLTTIQDVWKATDEIQKSQAKTKTLRGLNRIRPFMDALEKFAGTIEVFVQVKPEIMALIWVQDLRAYSTATWLT